LLIRTSMYWLTISSSPQHPLRKYESGFAAFLAMPHSGFAGAGVFMISADPALTEIMLGRQLQSRMWRTARTSSGPAATLHVAGTIAGNVDRLKPEV